MDIGIKGTAWPRNLSGILFLRSVVLREAYAYSYVRMTRSLFLADRSITIRTKEPTHAPPITREKNASKFLNLAQRRHTRDAAMCPVRSIDPLGSEGRS